MEITALAFLVGQRGENGLWEFCEEFNSGERWADVREVFAQSQRPRSGGGASTNASAGGAGEQSQQGGQQSGLLVYEKMMGHFHWRVVVWEDSEETSEEERRLLGGSVTGVPWGFGVREWVAECLGRERSSGRPGWNPMASAQSAR